MYDGDGMDKNTKDKIITELRFFMFKEKNPHHAVFRSTKGVEIVLMAFFPIALAAAVYAIVAWATYGLLGLGILLLLYMAVVTTVVEVPHYLCDRPGRKDYTDEDIYSMTDPRYDWAKRRSAREEAESKAGK